MPAIGVLTLELQIDHAHSLKDKRNVVKSLKDRLRSKFNVSVAEIDCQESWQRSIVAIVTVSAARGYAQELLQLVEKESVAILGGDLVGSSVEWLE